jgi:hypothetical protein
MEQDLIVMQKGYQTALRAIPILEYWEKQNGSEHKDYKRILCQKRKFFQILVKSSMFKQETLQEKLKSATAECNLIEKYKNAKP